MTEVPIVFRDRTAGESKMSGAIVREALFMVTNRALRNVLRHESPSSRRGRAPAPRPHVPIGAAAMAVNGGRWS
jgi:hypothetical protein